MKKRLRKKKHLGEFREIAFDCEICFQVMDMETEEYDRLMDRFLELITAHKFLFGGSSDEKSMCGVLAVQSYRVNADEMKSGLRDALQNLPEVTSVKFGENTDSHLC